MPHRLMQRFGFAEFAFHGDEAFGGKTVGLAEGGEEDAPQAGDGHAGDAADDDRAHRSPPVGGEAAFVLAELVGCAEEEPVDGADAATHFGRRGQLQDAGTDDHRDHVAGSDDDQRDAA
jgi:hypothetical protein